MSDPVVTILIAAFNAEATLEQAIRDASAQTAPVDVVVIDDASTDQTVEIAWRAAADLGNVRVIEQPVNRGPAAARNLGLDESRAPWVTMLDSDDRMEPDRIARLLEIARKEEADFVADDLWKQHVGDPSATRVRMLGEETLGLMTLSAEDFVRGNLSARHGGRREFGFLKPLMSRAFLDRHGLRYDPGIRLGEDFVLYTQALIAGAKAILTDPQGYVALVRPNSLSGRHPTEAHEHLIRADRALLALPDVTPGTRAALRAHLMEQRKKWAWRRMIDAMRETDIKAALACFWAPPQVSADLLARLGREAWERLGTR